MIVLESDSLIIGFTTWELQPIDYRCEDRNKLGDSRSVFGAIR
jgi:hypothetical protein